MSDIETQIRNTFMKAMTDSIETITNSEHINEENVKWLIKLTGELIIRINNLTPNRHDLHVALCNSIDLELLEQMLSHSACDREDFQSIAHCIISRLQLLCAPSQDNDLKVLQERLATTTNLGKSVGLLIMECNKIIDEIETLMKNFSS